jgi:DNA repair protein RecO (recombination protein O)
MYHKHNTEGIVIRGSERGEASKDILIFSREFGMIYASVQNARAMNSKLRYSVQDYCVGEFTLIKGKNSWKLVGAEVQRILNTNLNILSNIFLLLRRLSGEEKNEELYEIILETLNNLESIQENENLVVLKILKNLGYLEQTEDQIVEISQNRSQALEIINNSLRAADLI